MNPTVTPFLMFDGKAEEAMSFYAMLFPNSAILSISRYGPGEGGAEGSVMQGTFSLNGREFLCIDSPVKHGFGFTPAISMFVECGSEPEVDVLYAALADGGSVLMPLGDYSFSPRFGWVADRFGVSWQISVRRDGA